MKQEKMIKNLKTIGIIMIVVSVIFSIDIVIKLLEFSDYYEMCIVLQLLLVLGLLLVCVGYGFCCISKLFNTSLHSDEFEKYREEYIKNIKSPHSFL